MHILRALRFLVWRAILALFIAALVMLLPLPEDAPGWLVSNHIPVVVFVLLCYMGKLLYDTLFYDHFWP